MEGKENSKKEKFNLEETINYFNKNKIFYFFLFVSTLGNIVWYSILGMPMLLLTEKLKFTSQVSSYLILGLGITY